MSGTRFSGPVTSDNGFIGSLTLADPLAVSAIEAADATASATIANSTGVMTITSAIVPTLATTTIKAADATAAATIANSTGVITVTSGVVTTLTSTTGTVTTLKTGTIQARDATGAATIANSTGIVTFATGVNVAAVNITTDTTTGTKIGGGATQKLSLWGVATVVQPSSTGTVTGYTSVGGSAVLSQSTFTGNTGTTAYTIGDVVLALKQAGILLV